MVIIVLPDSVTSVGKYSFSFCSSLEGVTIGNRLITLEEGTFYCCENLKEIIVPISIVSIGDLAFEECFSLSNIYYEGTKAQWKNISIGAQNTYLTEASIHYYSPR